MSKSGGQDIIRTGRRQFIRALGAASLGVAAAGIPGMASMSAPAGARLDPDAPLRIGLIGNTGHLYLVTREVENVPNARITACSFEDGDWEFNSDGSRRGGSYDMEPNRKWVEGQSWAAGGVNIYETYQEMLDKEELDMAVVCLPYARNAHAAAAAARAGLHILCEKPVAVNFEDLDMLEKAVERSGVRLTAMFAIRFAPEIYTMKQSISSGSIGRPIMGRGQKSYRFGESRPWFYKHPEIYGSTILWVGIHAIDYIRWSMGLEVTKVSGFQSNLAHPEYPGCQDNAVVNMELEGGATAAVTMDYLRPASAPTHGDDRLRVIGSEGVIERKDIDGKVELITTGQGPRVLEQQQPPSLFADFVNELRGRGTHLIGPDEAVRVTRICIAATRAAEQGRVMEV